MGTHNFPSVVEVNEFAAGMLAINIRILSRALLLVAALGIASRDES
jgi:hypothetical protein